ncbi:MAG: hypothetical protein KF799_10640 [Bdellovibrionales bacterium]|nr:hypothetical protein [Bdellovibrionales bacterium]
MFKTIACIVLASSMNVYANTDSAPTDELVLTDAEELEIGEDLDQNTWAGMIENVQWHGGSRMWTCWVRSRQGRTFTGSSTNRNSARRIAMSRCGSVSTSCQLRTCR